VRRSRVRLAVELEEVEARRLLSGAAQVLSTHTYEVVVSQVQHIMVNLTRTDNVGHASTSLANLAASIPHGSQQLAPLWQNDVAEYDPMVRGSAIATYRRLVGDLKQDVVNGVGTGEITVTGPAGPAFLRLSHLPSAPQASADSVNISNNTSYSLKVVANLSGTTQYITKTIPIQGTAPFNFGTNTNKYITVTISRADNGKPPAPYFTTLNRPINGYYGKLFTVSAFGGFFSVST
jgi:hypothetical protein